MMSCPVMLTFPPMNHRMPEDDHEEDGAEGEGNPGETLEVWKFVMRVDTLII